MKKIINIFLTVYPFLLFAQVGIGRDNPRGALDINGGSGTSPHGLVLPTNDDPSLITNPQSGSVVPGTIIYDSQDDCVKLYTNTGWSDCIDGGGGGTPPTLPELDCYDSQYVTNPVFTSDPIRARLLSPATIAAYDAAEDGDVVFVTIDEYYSLVSINSFLFHEPGTNYNGVNTTVNYTFTGGSNSRISQANRFLIPLDGYLYRFHLLAYAVNSPESQSIQFQIFKFNTTSSSGGIRLLATLPEVQVSAGQNYFVFKNSVLTFENLNRGSSGSSHALNNFLQLGVKHTGRMNYTSFPGYPSYSVATNNNNCGNYTPTTGGEGQRMLINAGGFRELR